MLRKLTPRPGVKASRRKPAKDGVTVREVVKDGDGLPKLVVIEWGKYLLHFLRKKRGVRVVGYRSEDRWLDEDPPTYIVQATRKRALAVFRDHERRARVCNQKPGGSGQLFFF